MSPQSLSRRNFAKMSAAALAAATFGVYSFPKGREVIWAAGPGIARITRSYTSQRIASLSNLEEGQPIDFTYPFEAHNNFIVKLGKDAWDGVGPDHDIVAFNYLCTHMGGPCRTPTATNTGPWAPAHSTSAASTFPRTALWSWGRPPRASPRSSCPWKATRYTQKGSPDSFTESTTTLQPRPTAKHNF